MDKKYLIATDTHLNDSNYEIVLNFFKEICAYAKENNIKTFLHLGDFFSNRKFISLKILPIIYLIGDMLEETFDDTYIIIGNHDIFYNDTLEITSLQLFRFYKNISIVDEPFQIDNDTILLPWLSTSDDISRWKKFSNIMGHFDINNVVLNRSGTISKKCGLNQSDFSDFKTVLSGHFHTPGIYGNIQYLGAPYHMSFNDTGERGYYIWDKKNLDFIEFKGYNKFIIINQDNEILENEISNNNIRLDFTRKMSINEMDILLKKINNYNPKSLKTKFNIKPTADIPDNPIDLNTIIDNKKIILTYFEKNDIPEHINKKVLESFITFLIEE